jgi:hypothetical protein
VDTELPYPICSVAYQYEANHLNGQLNRRYGSMG